MSASSMVHDWRGTVRDLLPTFHGHQTNALADLGLAVALAGDCRAGRVAPRFPTAAAPVSTRRRFERVLANPRLRPRVAQRDLAGGPGVGLPVGTRWVGPAEAFRQAGWRGAGGAAGGRAGEPPARLLLALAVVRVVSLGGEATRAGRRRDVTPHRRRRRRIVQVELQWLRHAVTHALYDRLRLRRLYLYPE